MTIVERIYPGFQWANPMDKKGLHVTSIGSDLEITGLVPSYKVDDSACDLIRQYEKVAKQVAIGQERTVARRVLRQFRYG